MKQEHKLQFLNHLIYLKNNIYVKNNIEIQRASKKTMSLKYEKFYKILIPASMQHESLLTMVN